MLYARNKELAPYHISSNQAFLLFVIYYHSHNHPDHRITLAELTQQADRRKTPFPCKWPRWQKTDWSRKSVKFPIQSVEFRVNRKGLDVFHKSKDWKTDKAIMSALSKEEIDLLMALLKKSSRKPKNINKSCLNHNINCELRLSVNGS